MERIGYSNPCCCVLRCLQLAIQNGRNSNAIHLLFVNAGECVVQDFLSINQWGDGR